jgi:hypothetical protein
MREPTPNLSQQIEAVELAAHRARQKRPLSMRDAEREEHARRLDAAAKALKEASTPCQPPSSLSE